jgi:hypothetical protein
MKTTVDLDGEKLERIMRSMGFKTRKEAIDWALTEAERLAVIHRIEANPWTPEMLKDAIAPGYDILAIRRGIRSGKGE